MKKICAKCKRLLATTGFNRQKKSPDGLQYYCKECVREAGRKWDSEHRESRRVASRTANKIAYRKDPEKFKKRARAYAVKNPDRMREHQKRKRHRLRQAVFDAYGRRCACCGETEEKFLSIDHIDGGGGKHRKTIGNHICQWLKVRGFPAGFQILCYNCNLAKGFYGRCPHGEGKQG